MEKEAINQTTMKEEKSIAEHYIQKEQEYLDYQRKDLANEIRAWQERKLTMLIEEVEKRGWRLIIPSSNTEPLTKQQ